MNFEARIKAARKARRGQRSGEGRGGSGVKVSDLVNLGVWMEIEHCVDGSLGVASGAAIISGMRVVAAPKSM